MKTLTRTMRLMALIPLLITSQVSFSKDIIRSEVQQIKMNFGEKVAFYSDNLKEQREFFIRLPKGYKDTKRDYPVIYLLDANNETLTYMKNLYFHSVTQIDRLMEQGDIPESIVVGLPFKSNQWFSNVSSNSEPFRDYLTKELSSYINDNYRTANNNILIGQSYSALFVINSLPSSSKTFNSYVAIEPILASGELEKAVKNYQSISIKNTRLQIIMGGTTFLGEATALTKQLDSVAGKVVDVSIEVFPMESHGSAYYPALNSGLRKHFKDFRKPSKELILAEDFDQPSLLKYFENRTSKYQVETTEKQFQFAVFDTIYYQIMAKKFEQAFVLWPIWKSEYKMYNANNITNKFLRQNDRASAITFLQHVIIAMPNAVRAVDRLATLYQQENKPEQARVYRLKVKQLLTDILSKPMSLKQEDSLNRYGYNLMGANRNQEALTIFKRIVQAKPESINAYDSLTDAYESVKDYTMAQKTLEKAISLANIKGDYDTAAFQQRLSRLTNRKDVD